MSPAGLPPAVSKSGFVGSGVERFAWLGAVSANNDLPMDGSLSELVEGLIWTRLLFSRPAYVHTY